MPVKRARLSIASGIFILAMLAAPAQIAPVAISSGFTNDAVLESPDGSITGDLSNNLDSFSDVLVAHDYAAAHTDIFDPAGVLPQNGTITNPANGAVFQFQPYDAPNVAVVNDDVTLTLAQPAAYGEISFLVNNRVGRGAGPLSFTLNYAGGASVDGFSAAAVPYWESGNPGDGQLAASLTTVLESGVITLTVDFDEYDFTLDPSAGLLESITFHPGSNKLDVYAVSGIDPVEVPEPRVWAMLATAVFAAILARRCEHFTS